MAPALHDVCAAMWLTVIAAGAAAGLASIPHCAAMCGPLAAFACARGGKSRLGPVGYQVGRTVSYALLGALAGGLGRAVTGGLSHVAVSWVMSWAMAAALGLAAWRMWNRGRPVSVRLVPLRAGRPGPSLFERVAARLPRSPFVLATFTALLPCGALAAAVALAAGTASPVFGAASMVAFATTTGLGLLGAGYVGRWLKLSGRPVLGRVLAVALALGAVLLALRPLSAHSQAHPTDPSPPAATCPL